MTAFVLLTTLFLPVAPAHAQQTNNSETSKTTKKSSKLPELTIFLSFGKGSGLICSDFYESPPKAHGHNLWHAEVNFTEANYDTTFQAEINKKVSDLELSAHGQGFKIGPIRTGVGFMAKQLLTEEGVFESRNLIITGETQKQLAIVMFETGIGKHNKSHFRIGGLAGRMKVSDNTLFLINGFVTNKNNTNYNKDSLPVYGSEFRIKLNLTKAVSIGLNGYSFSPHENEQGLLAEKYSNLEGEIHIFPIKRVGVLARASLSKSPSETFSINNYVSINMILKLKTP